MLGVIVIYVAVVLYSVFDVAIRPADRVRVMPKVAWIAVLLVVPVVGIVLWFLFGRGAAPVEPTRVVAPDDDPDFLRKLSEDLDWEKQKKRDRKKLGRDLDDD